ncbi:PaaX family transcriptional regulator C-terminal domain-containing protein [Jannaschia marina]|uniref:PaaX family transcriptional regulator C-terminal domain-containing protein n=1 Tax=Jannaschia marina TaxID=2741674 RepID=UPI0015C81B11|nr:PaaX family transcriptional regulator C-terminal domain-containing protein [Jannaschia marina]
MSSLIDILTDGRPPRTWSMLVTIFGDLALDPGTRLTGRTLAALTAPMGIRPEALRTALHRLRRDGWIESTRHGRLTAHALTEFGRDQSRAAGPRIYGADIPTGLYLHVTEPGALQEGCVIAPGLALATTPGDPLLPLDTVPDWMQARVCPPDLLGQTNAFADRIEALARRLETETDTSLRLVIVHEWRRLVLRTPALPDRAFPETWRGAEARAHIRALLTALPRPDYSTSSIEQP